MKKRILISVVLVFAVSLNTSIYAGDAESDTEYSDHTIHASRINYQNLPINKLLRGSINMLTCVVEIPAEALNTSNKQAQNRVLGWFYGGLVGTFTAFIRALTGAFDVATFFIPPYNKPLMNPEYAFQSFQDKIDEHR